MGTLDQELLEAAYRGDRMRVQCLLAGGTDARAVAEYGEAALERVVECGHAAVARLLLESGVQFDFSKDDARHLLYGAAPDFMGGHQLPGKNARRAASVGVPNHPG